MGWHEWSDALISDDYVLVYHFVPSMVEYAELVSIVSYLLFTSLSGSAVTSIYVSIGLGGSLCYTPSVILSALL